MKHTHKYKKLRKIKSKKGGALEEHGLPVCDRLSFFPIKDEAITTFQRSFNVPMDCVINALQLMNILDTHSANIMRISALGTQGFTSNQIELIFMYNKGYNFSFKSTINYQEWIESIYTLLPPGNVVFAGYVSQTGGKHVFLIGRYANGMLMYIDPQTSPLCPLTHPTCAGFVNEQREWYLLFNSTIPLSPGNIRSVTKYIQALQKQS